MVTSTSFLCVTPPAVQLPVVSDTCITLGLKLALNLRQIYCYLLDEVYNYDERLWLINLRSRGQI